jgi:hypothetical protein
MCTERRRETNQNKKTKRTKKKNKQKNMTLTHELPLHKVSNDRRRVAERNVRLAVTVQIFAAPTVDQGEQLLVRSHGVVVNPVRV